MQNMATVEKTQDSDYMCNSLTNMKHFDKRLK